MNKLIINCGLCDLRHVSEESLQTYESVVINCATAVVTRESQDVLHRFPVQINAGDILQVPAGQDVIRLQSHNGSHTLDGSAAPDGLTFLMVNGKLIIGEDALEAARQYYRIQVNGKTILPRSFTGQLTNLSVNGKTVAYPDGAALLKDTAVIDRFFPLRALGRLYYAASRLVFLDADLDVQALAEKGVRFESPKAVVAASLCERLLPLLDDQAEIAVVEDGTAFVADDTELDDAVLRRYGTRLYVNGDLSLNQRSRDALAKLEKLYVTGAVRLPRDLQEAFSAVDAEYGSLRIIRPFEHAIRESVRAKVDRALLEKYPGGLLVEQCANLCIAEDVPPEMILERLVLQECARVRCSPEQESAVAAVGSEIGCIVTSDEEEAAQSLPGLPAESAHVINAATYVW